jgi:hypothetical protein
LGSGADYGAPGKKALGFFEIWDFLFGTTGILALWGDHHISVFYGLPVQCVF